MKQITTLVLLLLGFQAAFSQFGFRTNISRPACNSNAADWELRAVRVMDGATYVCLDLYTPRTDVVFTISSGMYLENAAITGGKKIYVRDFRRVKNDSELTADERRMLENPFTSAMRDIFIVENLSLDTKTYPPSRQLHRYVLMFDGIPANWTSISLSNPVSNDGKWWYWKNISLDENEKAPLHHFVSEQAIDLLATLAHPFTTFKFANYNVDYNTINMTLFFEGGITTVLRIRKNGSLFNSVEVVSDNDCLFCYPFTSLSFIRTTLLGQSNYSGKISSIEQAMGKYVSAMDGEELASVVLNLQWLAYQL